MSPGYIIHSLIPNQEAYLSHFIETPPHRIMMVEQGKDGRFLMVKVMIYGKIFTIVNLYLPNQDQIKNGVRVLSGAMEKAEGVIILGGDFNFIMDTDMDTTNTQTYRKKAN